jgi:hypothetical protein
MITILLKNNLKEKSFRNSFIFYLKAFLPFASGKTLTLAFAMTGQVVDHCASTARIKH